MCFATQLQELNVGGCNNTTYSEVVAALLPPSLKRLSWSGRGVAAVPDLSHLSQVTFLRLSNWGCGRLSSSKLPPALQELQVQCTAATTEVLLEQQQVLTCYRPHMMVTSNLHDDLAHLPHLRMVCLSERQLQDPAVHSALAKLDQLSELVVVGTVRSRSASPECVPPVLPAASAIRNLRRLSMYMQATPQLTGLSALSGLTQLRLQMQSGGGSAEQYSAMAAEVGAMASLQWLEVPAGCLQPGRAWLGGLQQLRVLVVHCRRGAAEDASCACWLEGCSPQVLPPLLQVLSVDGSTAPQAAGWQVRRRLQQALSSSGCEVVVGIELREVADPTQQLAGLPVALQQVLA
jgi:hypothetical protein